MISHEHNFDNTLITYVCTSLLKDMHAYGVSYTNILLDHINNYEIIR